jgi:hypothetical protein
MPNLFDYMQRVQQLCNDMRQQLSNPGFIIPFINTARGQVAGEGECIRGLGEVQLTTGIRRYYFSDINFTGPAGLGGVLNVRRIACVIDAVSGLTSSGLAWMAPRSWEWFDLYCNGDLTAVNDPGIPTQWAQYAQGVDGSFHIHPSPDNAYTLQVDTVLFPLPMVDETTAEAIPYPWTDAVPYFASYLIYLFAQKQDSAKGMFDLYTTFMKRARQMANPSVNRGQYEQAADPTEIAKLGMQPKGAA